MKLADIIRRNNAGGKPKPQSTGKPKPTPSPDNALLFDIPPLSQVEQIRVDLPPDLQEWLDQNLKVLREHKRRLAKRKDKPIGIWARMEAMDNEEGLALRAKWHAEKRQQRHEKERPLFRKHMNKKAKQRVARLERRLNGSVQLESIPSGKPKPQVYSGKPKPQTSGKPKPSGA